MHVINGGRFNLWMTLEGLIHTLHVGNAVYKFMPVGVYTCVYMEAAFAHTLQTSFI